MASDALELAFWMFVSHTYVLGTEPGSNIRWASGLNYWAIFLAPLQTSFNETLDIKNYGQNLVIAVDKI